MPGTLHTIKQSPTPAEWASRVLAANPQSRPSKDSVALLASILRARVVDRALERAAA